MYRANDVINHIESVPDMDNEEKARIKAEALVLRAYGYYNLNVLWSGVPIYTENVEPLSMATVSQTARRGTTTFRTRLTWKGSSTLTKAMRNG